MNKYNKYYKPRPLTPEELEEQLKKLQRENPTQKKKSKRRHKKKEENY